MGRRKKPIEPVPTMDDVVKIESTSAEIIPPDNIKPIWTELKDPSADVSHDTPTDAQSVPIERPITKLDMMIISRASDITFTTIESIAKKTNLLRLDGFAVKCHNDPILQEMLLELAKEFPDGTLFDIPLKYRLPLYMMILASTTHIENSKNQLNIVNEFLDSSVDNISDRFKDI